MMLDILVHAGRRAFIPGNMRNAVKYRIHVIRAEGLAVCASAGNTARKTTEKNPAARPAKRVPHLLEPKS